MQAADGCGPLRLEVVRRVQCQGGHAHRHEVTNELSRGRGDDARPADGRIPQELEGVVVAGGVPLDRPPRVASGRFDSSDSEAQERRDASEGS